MAIKNHHLSDLMENESVGIYRLNFLLTMDAAAARELTFQTFLYMGAAETTENKEAEQTQLYQFAIHACEDYFYRKMRRAPKREKFQAACPFYIEDELWGILQWPFQKKAVFYLYFCVTQELERISAITGIKTGEIKKLLGNTAICPHGTDSFSGIIFDTGNQDWLTDQVYMRFEERNVGLENKLLNIRSTMDRAVPWIAVGILVFFAAAAWYTAQL